MQNQLLPTKRMFSCEHIVKKGVCSGCTRVVKEGALAFIRTYVDSTGKEHRTLLCNLRSCWEDWDFYTWKEKLSNNVDKTEITK